MEIRKKKKRNSIILNLILYLYFIFILFKKKFDKYIRMCLGLSSYSILQLKKKPK